MTRLENKIEFRGEPEGLKHLIQHVLTPPESHAWHVVWHGKFTLLAGDAACMKSLAKKREELQSLASGQQQATLAADHESRTLMAAYLQSIEHQLSESQQLGWCVARHHESIQLDTNGIFSVTSGSGDRVTIVTAFLPGFGSAEGTQRSKQDVDDPHARCRAPSRMRRNVQNHRGVQADDDDISARLSSRRAEGWSNEERVYYLVFRPVVQFIRSRQPGLDANRRLSLVDLKDCLPRMSALKLENWQTLRKQSALACN